MIGSDWRERAGRLVLEPLEPRLMLDGSGADVAMTESGPAILCVDYDHTDDIGAGWPSPFDDLQDALAVAVAGNEIWVAAGTYYPTDTTDRSISFELVEGAALYGGFVGGETQLAQRDWETNETILSGDIPGDRSRQIVIGANAAVVDGFTIAHGLARDGLDEEICGAGMYNLNSSPTVRNCQFSDNESWWGLGGAMYNENSAPTVTNCLFEANGIWTEGGVGGAIFNRSSSPTFVDCRFIENHADDSGGGMYNDGDSWPTLIGCTFTGNTANTDGSGGGIHGGGTLINSIFRENWGGYGGGGISGPATVINSLFEANTSDEFGGGIWGEATVVNSTFVGNRSFHGGGVYGAATVANTIFWKNRGHSGNWDDIAGGAAVTYSDYYGGTGTNIDEDPLFVDPGYWDDGSWVEGTDYRLLAGSPGIDAADNTAVPPDTADLDGDGDTAEPAGRGSWTTWPRPTWATARPRSWTWGPTSFKNHRSSSRPRSTAGHRSARGFARYGSPSASPSTSPRKTSCFTTIPRRHTSSCHART